jgi:hypothetical protein
VEFSVLAGVSFRHAALMAGNVGCSSTLQMCRSALAIEIFHRAILPALQAADGSDG